MYFALDIGFIISQPSNETHLFLTLCIALVVRLMLPA